MATVAAGLRHSLALTVSGKVYWWGGYRVSDTDSHVQALPLLVGAALANERVRSIAARGERSFAVTDAGMLSD